MKKMWKKIIPILSIILLMAISPLTSHAEKVQSNLADPPTTGFEDRDGDGWTTLEEEEAFLQEVSDLSDRVTYEQIGTSVEGRALFMAKVGYPEPPSDDEIADGRNVLIMGTPHGNEPAGREMTLKTLRDLAFSDDPETINMLSDSTILFVPTPNPDGRYANTRQNAQGIDNNRDHLKLETPEITTIANVLNTYKPDLTVDAHERPGAYGDPDVEMLWPRNLNVDESLRELNIEMVEDYLFPDVEDAGFSTGLYGTPPGSGSGSERILRNMGGLRHGLSLLIETPGKADPTARVDMHMATIESVLHFYQERFEDIGKVITEAPERKAAAGENQEPFYLDGTHGWDEADWVAKDPAPSGYLLTNDQVSKISKHIELFSIETESIGNNGSYISMKQPMMTVIPLLLDEGASYNEAEGLALYNGTNPGTAENMKKQVEHFEREGEFASEVAARALKTHLIAVDQFEKEYAVDKVIKHLTSLVELLDHQYSNELLSEEAYNNLYAYAYHLLEKWEVSFDSNKAITHLQHLSVDIGPRVTGTDEEHEAAEYIENEFASLGYDVSIQDFDIRDGQKSQNVIAVKKPEGVEDAEIVYVTSHYDSVPGSPGANDNGSGTSTILEMARMLKDSPTDKEIRFITFGAEEIGLVGSKHYVSQLSDDEVNRSIANFNLDMVGTAWEPASQLYVNTVDGDANLVWDFVKSASDDLGHADDLLNLYQFGRSDHVPFYDAGIDSALFIWMEPGTAGLEPWYHSPEDTIEHVSPEKIQIVGDIVSSAVAELLSVMGTSYDIEEAS